MIELSPFFDNNYLANLNSLNMILGTIPESALMKGSFAAFGDPNIE